MLGPFEQVCDFVKSAEEALVEWKSNQVCTESNFCPTSIRLFSKKLDHVETVKTLPTFARLLHVIHSTFVELISGLKLSSKHKEDW